MAVNPEIVPGQKSTSREFRARLGNALVVIDGPTPELSAIRKLGTPAPNAARCPTTGNSSALSVRPSSIYYGLFPILRRLRPLLQHLAIPDSAFARVAG